MTTMRGQHDTVGRLMALAATHFDKSAADLRPADDLFEALGIDSMQAMDLLSRLEDEFDVEIPDYELQDVKTFEGLAEVIGRRL